MKFYCASILAVALAGCGTIDTTLRPDSTTANQLTRWKSNCSSVPRVYGGVSLDFCALHAEQRPFKNGEIRPAAALVLLDMAASGVADTVLLPYTVYLQHKHGNIEATRYDR